jgi:hypothetical protein
VRFSSGGGTVRDEQLICLMAAIIFGTAQSDEGCISFDIAAEAAVRLKDEVEKACVRETKAAL